MSSVLIISGSPSSTSRTERLARSIATRIGQRDISATLLDVRSLPAADLLHARFDAPSIVEAIAQVAAADPEHLMEWIERVLTAERLADVFGH